MQQKTRIAGVFKNVIAPVQAWLLSQGRCVGCGRELASGKKSKHRAGEKVVCECGRIFISEPVRKQGSLICDPKNKKYRRALLEEV